MCNQELSAFLLALHNWTDTVSCSFPEVKVAFSFPDDTSEIGVAAPYFCTIIAGCIPAVAMLCATSTLPLLASV